MKLLKEIQTFKLSKLSIQLINLIIQILSNKNKQHNLKITTTHQMTEQLKDKVQQKIKLMLRQKRLRKASEKINSEKPISVYHQKLSKQTSDFQKLYEDQYEKPSYRRMKSIANQSSSVLQQKHGSKLLLKSKQELISRGNFQIQSKQIKRMPSQQKLGQQPKLKRPSSVINKSTRSTTSKSRRANNKNQVTQKQIQKKVKQSIQSVFLYGAKLSKFLTQQHILSSQAKYYINQQINLLSLINRSKKYYVTDRRKQENEQENEALTIGVQKQIISCLQRKGQKQKNAKNCFMIQDRITGLISSRLELLLKKHAKNQ